MMTIAIGWFITISLITRHAGGQPPRAPRPRARPPTGVTVISSDAPGGYRPAESSVSSATYGWPSRQAAICSGRP